MTIRITEQDEPSGHVIRLEGSLCGEDARLVERLCAEAGSRPDPRVVVDLNEVTFLDETSAAVLRRLRAAESVTLRGCRLFNKRAIDDAK
jgi:anti-anti-sigma regulatory factor